MRIKETAGIKRHRRNKKDIIFYSVLIFLPLVQIAIFYFGVNFQSILMHFNAMMRSRIPLHGIFGRILTVF